MRMEIPRLPDNTDRWTGVVGATIEAGSRSRDCRTIADAAKPCLTRTAQVRLCRGRARGLACSTGPRGAAMSRAVMTGSGLPCRSTETRFPSGLCRRAATQCLTPTEVAQLESPWASGRAPVVDWPEYIWLRYAMIVVCTRFLRGLRPPRDTLSRPVTSSLMRCWGPAGRWWRSRRVRWPASLRM